MGEKLYAGSYPWRGSRWAFDIYAENQREADAKLDALKAWGKIDGEIHMIIPVVLPASLMTKIVNAICWWKNRGRP